MYRNKASASDEPRPSLREEVQGGGGRRHLRALVVVAPVLVAAACGSEGGGLEPDVPPPRPAAAAAAAAPATTAPAEAGPAKGEPKIDAEAANKLHQAAYDGDADVALAILDRHPALLDARTPRMSHGLATGATPLVIATTREHWQLAQELVRRGADPNLGDVAGMSPLLGAVRARNRHLAEVLLRAGADPNHCYMAGGFPVMWALDDPPLLRTLLEAGASPNVGSDSAEHDNYPLAMAASRGLPAAVRLLLRAGAEPLHGWKPPLHSARRGGDHRVVEFLLDWRKRAPGDAAP